MSRTRIVLTLLGTLFFVVDANAQDCGKARGILKDIHKVSKKISKEVGCTYVKAQTGAPKPLCKTTFKTKENLRKKGNKIARKA